MQKPHDLISGLRTYGHMGRIAWLLSTSALVFVLTVSLTPAAWAGGGAGGITDTAPSNAQGGGYGTPGANGAGSTGGSFDGGGGGGGGVGAGGGAGGSGGANGNEPGGSSGGAGSPAQAGGVGGTSGASFSDYGGGGGGGGGGGTALTLGSSATISASITGTNGGNGGSPAVGGGGGGGAGGYGIFETNAATITINSGVAVTAGAGGTGGTGGIYGQGGGGGDGGVGINFATSGSTLINAGTITGGNGGAGGGGAGYGAGSAGAGGIGVIGSGLTIINTGGTISGGFANAGAGAQNYAIQFTGGTNSVGTGGVITGGIDVAGGSFMPAAPGSSAGTTLAITGPLVFGTGTIYNVRITPTASDSVTVAGTATLSGASVYVAAGKGLYTAGTRTILTASALNGTFTGVTSNFAFLTPSLSYDANDVYLSFAGTPDYRTAAAGGNQYAIASALTNAGINNPNAPILTALNQLTAAQAQAAFNALSGEGITAANSAGLQMSGLFTDSMSDQGTLWLDGGHAGNEVVLTEPAQGALFYAPSSKMKTPIVVHDPVLPPVRTWRAWASGFGADETVHGDAGTGSAAQSLGYYGGAMGVDYQINPDILFGVAGSGSNGNFSVAGRSTYGSVTGGGIGVYGVATYGAYYLSSSTSAGFFHNSETRSVAGFGGLGSETDHGAFDSIAVRTRLEAGRRFAEIYGAAVTPFVALEIANLHSNGFSETPTVGAGVFALNTQGGDTAFVPAYLGLRFEKLYGLGNGMTLRPVLSVAYGHDFAAQRQITNTLLGLSGNPFEISGAQTARDFAQTKAGFELAFAPNAVAFVNFDGNFSSRDQLYGGKGGVKFTW